MFPLFSCREVTYVGEADASTNAMAVFFMDLAGNPYGTYDQEEACIHCGEMLKIPPERNLAQKIFTRVASYLQRAQKPLAKPHPNWIHILFEKAE
ncbi:hypothetical protein LPB19_09865 [Marinobacter salinisoli]|uniref:Uncharacterized protein n=1 Tax=Marinobacter salinisoli TaxID=2769486 RepID=A0ABX7MN75_9GAMM|nr:hypothetical protein [Marinobacter salinisoli]QSP93529.1 hypothetical protein LPB19_09865 [Marinobacter salinisoli]